MPLVTREPDCGRASVLHAASYSCMHLRLLRFEWLSSVQLAVQRIIALLHTDSTDYERFLAASGSELLCCKACPH